MAWWEVWKPGVIEKDEAWVVRQLNSLSKRIQLAQADIDAAVNWIMGHQTQILQDITIMLGVATQLGLSANPAVAAAEAAAQAALAAAAAYKAKRDAGATSVSAVVAAYNATKAAQIAHAQMAQALAENKK